MLTLASINGIVLQSTPQPAARRPQRPPRSRARCGRPTEAAALTQSPLPAAAWRTTPAVRRSRHRRGARRRMPTVHVNGIDIRTTLRRRRTACAHARLRRSSRRLAAGDRVPRTSTCCLRRPRARQHHCTDDPSMVTPRLRPTSPGCSTRWCMVARYRRRFDGRHDQRAIRVRFRARARFHCATMAGNSAGANDGRTRRSASTRSSTWNTSSRSTHGGTQRENRYRQNDKYAHADARWRIRTRRTRSRRCST